MQDVEGWEEPWTCRSCPWQCRPPGECCAPSAHCPPETALEMSSGHALVSRSRVFCQQVTRFYQQITRLKKIIHENVGPRANVVRHRFIVLQKLRAEPHQVTRLSAGHAVVCQRVTRFCQQITRVKSYPWKCRPPGGCCAPSVFFPSETALENTNDDTIRHVVSAGHVSVCQQVTRFCQQVTR